MADDKRNAPQHTVGIRYDIEKSRGARRPRQDREVTDDARGVEEALGAVRPAARAHRCPQRVQDARIPARFVEVELVVV